MLTRFVISTITGIGKNYIIKERRKTMNLFKDLLIRTIIIVSVTDIIEFYAITKKHLTITPLLVFAIIVITLIPLMISIWYTLHRSGII